MNVERSKTVETRRQLFETALRLFRKKGFDGTSADDIAAEAGVSRATFFNHFGNKAAVLRFFGQDLEERVSALLEHRDASGSPLEELRRILLVMAKEAEGQRENLRIVLMHSVQDGSYFSQPTPARAKILQHVTALIADAQGNGDARGDLTPAALAAQLMGLYNNAVLGILVSNQAAETAIDRLWEFALGGLTAAATDAGRGAGRKKSR
jgi:AcrR family transcriptional regulator